MRHNLRQVERTEIKEEGRKLLQKSCKRVCINTNNEIANS